MQSYNRAGKVPRAQRLVRGAQRSTQAKKWWGKKMGAPDTGVVIHFFAPPFFCLRASLRTSSPSLDNRTSWT